MWIKLNLALLAPPAFLRPSGKERGGSPAPGGVGGSKVYHFSLLWAGFWAHWQWGRERGGISRKWGPSLGIRVTHSSQQVSAGTGAVMCASCWVRFSQKGVLVLLGWAGVVQPGRKAQSHQGTSNPHLSSHLSACSLLICSLADPQWFSNLGAQKNHLGNPIKRQIPRSHPRRTESKLLGLGPELGWFSWDRQVPRTWNFQC